MAPTLLASGSRTFSSAVFTTSGAPFALYKTESPILTVTGSQTAGTKNTVALTGTRTFSVQPNDTAAYVKLSDSSNPSNATLSGVSFSQQTDLSKLLFAHLYDPYSNIKSNNSLVAWSGSGVLAGKFSPDTGANTTFAPTTAGTGGVVTASCTAISSGCLPDSTGSLTIDPSNVSKIVFISPSPSNNFTQLTTACQELKVQTQDQVNNAANVNADSAFVFTSTGGNGDFYATAAECTAAQAGGTQATPNTTTFHTSGLSGSAGSRTKTMTAGTNVISVWFANRTAVPLNAATINVAAAVFNRNITLSGTINPDAAKRVSYITTTPTVNAVGSPTNTCIPINYRFNDIWGNQQSLASTPTTSTINLSVTGANHGGSIHSDAACSTTAITSRSLNSVNQDTVYYKDTKANRSTFHVLSTSTLSGAQIQAASTIDMNVLPGSFTISESPTSGTKTKDTVTLSWSASAGVNHYAVSYGTTSSCGTSISSTAAGTSISFPTGLNGLYYLCVKANSFTADGTGLNATNYGTYNLYIDNTAPTGAISAPTLANIGPVTSEVATTGDSTKRTFAGTASDTGGAGAGLSKVELEIKTGSNFWNGSGWTTTASLVLASGTSGWSYSMANSNFTNASSYTIRAQVTDLAGNVTTTAASKTFTWDNVAPTADITAFGNLLSTTRYSNATNPSAAITTTSFATSYRYYLVAGSSCSGGTYSGDVGINTTTSLSPGADGQYTLCVIGKDQAQNEQASPTAFTWIKDTVAPTISGGVPNMGPVNSTFTPNLVAAIDTTPAAGASVINYLWTTTTNATNCTTAFGSTTQENTTITSTCSNNFGTSTLNLKVSDTAGNSTNYPATFNWDTQSRTISGISSPLNAVSKKAGDIIDIDVTFASGANSANVVVAGGTPTLALNTTPAQSASYVSGSGTNVLRFQYTVQATDNVATLNVTVASALSLGTGVTIKDSYGNNVTLTTPTTTLSAKTITIDTVAPTLSFTGLPSSGSESNLTTLDVGIAATDTTSYTYVIVSGTSADCTGTQSASITRSTTPKITNSISAMSDGDITICARATDAAGNVQSGYSSLTWKKDTQAPAVPTGVTPSGEVSTFTPTITWNAAAADVTDLRVVVYSNSGLSTSVYDSGVIARSVVSQAISTALPRDGRYWICLLSRDLAGNWSPCTSASATTFTVETDILHTSWYAPGFVKYGVKDKTQDWVVSDASSSLTYQGRTSIAVDPTGKPIIGFSTSNGTDSDYRYAKWNGSTTWTTTLVHSTTGNTNGGKLGELVVMDSSPALHLGFSAMNGDSTLGAQIVNMAAGNYPSVNFQAIQDLSLSFADLSVFVDEASRKYLVATSQIAGNHQPRMKESGSALYDPTLPTDCTSMPYVSGVSAQTGSTIYLAGLCIMSDNTCKVWVSSHSFNPGTSTFSVASPWTSLGTTKLSPCSLGNLSLADRPNIMQDKKTNKTSIVYVDRSVSTNIKIIRSSNEGTGWANEEVVTGLTGSYYGYPFLAIDQYSKSYVTYVDNGVLKMITNNGREHLVYTGGWNTPTVISNTGGLSGFGGLGITGMKGRGNYSGGN